MLPKQKENKNWKGQKPLIHNKVFLKNIKWRKEALYGTKIKRPARRCEWQMSM